jgi:hypothetical protein
MFESVGCSNRPPCAERAPTDPCVQPSPPSSPRAASLSPAPRLGPLPVARAEGRRLRVTKIGRPGVSIFGEALLAQGLQRRWRVSGVIRGCSIFAPSGTRVWLRPRAPAPDDGAYPATPMHNGTAVAAALPRWVACNVRSMLSWNVSTLNVCLISSALWDASGWKACAT